MTDDELERFADLSNSLASARYHLQKAERERDALKTQIATMKGSWKKWCDEHALERYEAMKAERDKYRALADHGEQTERRLRLELLKVALERRNSEQLETATVDHSMG